MSALMPIPEFEPLLQSHFGLPHFRRGQKEIISSVLSGKDVLAVLPTGGGKSLCYQYPAVAKNELVVVISPLIALMKDQVDSLNRMGIAAGCIHSGQSDGEKLDVFRRLGVGGTFVLYVSPERVQKDGFQRWIQKSRVALFAVDEAHCVSQWGHDFREDYNLLKVLKTLRPEVPVLALTASATPFVLNDIATQLGLKNPARHVHGFYRPNLYYQVEPCHNDETKLQWLHQALRQTPQGRILIYCGTRSVTEELADAISREFHGVGFYHAGLGTAERTRTQNAFASGELRILTATNAFGMGIDHPDVRLVVHFQIPANIDSLYQEMGRAGRDGRDSTCLLLYAKKDKGLQSFFIQRSKAPAHIQSSRWRGLENLIAYAEGGECRHAEILTYYQDSQRLEKCGHCDICLPQSERRVVKPVFEIPKSKTKSTRSGRKEKAGPAASEVLNEAQTRVFEGLRTWRREKARELDVPAFVVLSDRTLRHLAQAQPSELGQLNDIYGLGDAKIEKFGKELLTEILLFS
ncbi:MAG: ATP-dependent DNA helicase RecQ [Bdellovibrionales bacterium]|nr:ATP-dependent DNA helicase RecQ [Bdellovibrionales bacterium]